MSADSSFERLMKETLIRETGPLPGNEHPDLSLMMGRLAGEFDGPEQSRLSAHIATCPTCSERWQKLHAALRSEQGALDAKAEVRDLRTLVEARSRIAVADGVFRRTRERARVGARHPAFVAALSGAVAIALSLAAAIPLLRGPVVATSTRLNELTTEVLELRDQMGNSYAGITAIANSLTSSREPMADKLERYDWEALQAYEAQPNETWQSVCRDLLGDEELWPLVWLINRNVGSPSGTLHLGEMIRLPTLLRDADV